VTETIKIGPLRVRPHLRDGTPSGRWQLDIPARFTVDGRRVRSLFETKREASDEARRKLREIQLRGAVVGSTTVRSGITVSEIVEQWTSEQEARVRTLKKRVSSLATDLQRLDAVLMFLGSDDVASVSERRLVAYQEYRLGMGRKPNTINGELRSLHAVFGWTKKRGLIREVPTVEAIPLHWVEIDLPTQDEATRIIGHLPPKVALLVRFLAETGCRKGEAFNLTWADVDEVNGTVQIRSKEGWTPKTQHSGRRIYLSAGLLDHLRRQRKVSQWVFAGRDPTKRVTRFDDALATAVKRAGVVRNGQPMHITPHMLRKANATWQAMRGVHEAILQPMLGHAAGSKVTAKHYVHATPEAMRQAVLELPIREQNETDNVTKLATSGNKQEKRWPSGS